MARQDTLSILTSTDGKSKLAEAYRGMIQFIQENTISGAMKNKMLSGDVSAGTVFAKRMVTSESKPYGTARAAMSGEKIKIDEVEVIIDTNRELIAEVENRDVMLYGVANLINQKVGMHRLSMQAELETAFFDTMSRGGTATTPTATAIQDKVDEVVRTLHLTTNFYVNKVPKNMIKIIASPKTYDDLRAYLDTVSNPNVNTAAGLFGSFHGIPIVESPFLPDGVDFIATTDNTVAQPVRTSLMDTTKKELSDIWAFGIFYYYGTKVVTPDLIRVVGTPSARVKVGK